MPGRLVGAPAAYARNGQTMAAASAGTVEDGPAVLRLAANTCGRDFVIGDIHGCMDAIIDTMSAVRFDMLRDRLFACGDLVDRGEDNEDVAALIDEPWFFSVRGNHDQAAIDLYRSMQGSTEPPQGQPQIAPHADNQWLRELIAGRPGQAHGVVARLARLPLAISIMGRHVHTGIVHADMPRQFSWHAGLRSLACRDPKWASYVMWARPAFEQSGEVSAVAGVDRIYVGHTPLVRPRQLGNVWYIDGGGVYKATRERHSQSRAHYMGAWNLVRLDTPADTLLSPPQEYGLLRVYGAEV